MTLPRWLRWRSPAELEEELQAHIDLETQDNIDRGLSPEHARLAAQRRFGNRRVVQQRAREADPLYIVDLLLQDVRFGVRHLLRTPLVATCVLATLVLGISLYAAGFAIVNTVLLRPLVSRAPETFVQLFASVSGEHARTVHGSWTMFTLDEYRTLSESARSLAAVTASSSVRVSLGAESVTELRAALVSCNYLAAHLDAPLVGRGFGAGDCVPATAQPVVVLNESLWRNAFGAAPSIVGRDITLNNQRFTVIGVTPDQLTGIVPSPAVWLPYTMQPRLVPGDDFFRDPAEHAWLDLSGRLASGYDHVQVDAEMAHMASVLDRVHPGRRMHIQATTGARIEDPSFSNSPRTRVAVSLLMGSLSLILLVVCGNATILLLAKAADRRQEMAIRLALGAGRVRLLRQLLVESLLLAVIAAVVSLWLAPRVPPVLAAMSDVPLRGASFGVDWRVFVLTLGAALVAGIGAGLSPALESLRVRLTDPLKPLGRGGAGRTSARVRTGLVCLQLAVSLALVATAALAWRAQVRAVSMDVGYDPHTVLQVPLPDAAGGQADRAWPFVQSTLDHLESLPGVRRVALARGAPFGRLHSTDVRAARGGHIHSTFFRRVSPSYFDSLGIRVLQGRSFDMHAGRADDAVTPIVVSASLVRQIWPADDPLGRRLYLQDRELEVVGVVTDTFSLRFGEPDGPLFYEPLHASTLTDDTVVLVAFSGDADVMTRAVTSEMRARAPQYAGVPTTIGAAIDGQRGSYALVSTLSATLAGLTLVLCLLALYGLASSMASQRTHEMGIRLALGARPADVTRRFLIALARPVVAGCVAGIGLAVVLGHVMARARLLSDLSAVDPLMLSGATVLIVATALVATLVPARRIAHVNPWRSLRDE